MRRDLARRFAQRHAGRVFFVAPWRAWLVFDGGAWRVDRSDLVQQFAQRICCEADHEAAAAGATTRSATMGSAATVAAVARLAGEMLKLPPESALRILPRRCAFFCNERIRRTLPPAVRPPRGFVARNDWFSGGQA